MASPDSIDLPADGKFAQPRDGWLKSTRLRQGISLRMVAERLEVSPQAVHQFEKSEVAGTISLRQLENVARVMGCRVVYALRPRETRRRDRASIAVEPAPDTAGSTGAATAPATVEHSMFLENQAAERFD